MEFDARVAAFVLLSALLIVTPGPDTALIIRNALAAGPRASSYSAIGVAIGILAWATAATFGVGVLLEQSSIAFTALKLAGGVYLCYLGVRTLLTTHREADQPGTGSTGRAALTDWTAFQQGLVSNLLNPKTGAFFVVVMPQFLMPGDSVGRGVRGDAAGLAHRVRPRGQPAGPNRARNPGAARHDPAHGCALDRPRRAPRLRTALGVLRYDSQ